MDLSCEPLPASLPAEGALPIGHAEPFSDVRLTGLLAESIELHGVGALSNAFASVAAETRAAGEEAAELFDVDIGL